MPNVPTIRCDQKVKQSIQAIPGYKGYLPGVKAETLGEGLFSTMVYESQGATKRLCHNEQANIREKDAPRVLEEMGGMPGQRVASTDELLKEKDNKRGEDDIMTGYVPAAGE